MGFRMSGRLIVGGAVSLLAALVPGGIGITATVQDSAVRPYSRQSDVIYGRKDGLALTMEVLGPRKPNGLAVIWVVSSSGRSSREQTLTTSFERRVLPFLQRGYAVFAVIHGSSPRFQLQDHVQDVRRAVRFVFHRAADYHVDPRRLGIAGSSSGGLTALLIAMHGDDGDARADDPVMQAPSRVQAAGAFFAPSDLLQFGEGEETVLQFMQRRYAVIDPSFEFFDVEAKTGARTRIEEPDAVARTLREFSPIRHVTRGDPPTILIHGTADALVPIEQSRRLARRLRDAGVPVQLLEREGMAHAWPGWEAEAALIADWFETHLRVRGNKQ